MLPSLRANALEKGKKPSVLPPAMGKQLERLAFLALDTQPVLEKENSEFTPTLILSKIDLASHPVRNGGVG